jgi:AraC-like DNA-binding protein
MGRNPRMTAGEGGHGSAREEAVLWRDPALLGIELLRARYRTFEFARHTHETFAIGVTERGSQTYTSRRHREVVMPAGTVAVVNPGEVHTSRAGDARGWSYRMLYPGCDLLRELADDARGRRGGVPFFPAAVIQDPELAGRLRDLHRACERSETPQLERESRLCGFLTDLIVRHAQERPTPVLAPVDSARVRRACELLDACPAKVTLRDLAELAGLSPYHFLRVFRHAQGLPPHAYLIQARVRRAQELLRRGASAVEVALAAGFADQSHLTRHFKRLTGVTPGAYAAGRAAPRA